MQPERGDVVRSADPFKLGKDRQRPWLILNTDAHPFGTEQSIAAAISTKQYDDSIALPDTVWEVGGVPRASFVSPWAIHSPRHEDLIAWQGHLTDEFVEDVVDALSRYFRH